LPHSAAALSAHRALESATAQCSAAIRDRDEAIAARNAAQQWGQYAAGNANQRSGLRMGRRQLRSQIDMNQLRQRDSQLRFGIQALGGLIR
jgi:hypothetical protein